MNSVFWVFIFLVLMWVIRVLILFLFMFLFLFIFCFKFVVMVIFDLLFDEDCCFDCLVVLVVLDIELELFFDYFVVLVV